MNPRGHAEQNCEQGFVLPCRVVMKPLDLPVQDCEQGGCFILPGCQEAAGPPGAGLGTRGMFYPARLSGIRWAYRRRTANKGVVVPCWVVMKPVDVKGPDCEQGGCFVLPCCQESAGPPGAGLRKRELFYPAGLS